MTQFDLLVVIPSSAPSGAGGGRVVVYVDRLNQYRWVDIVDDRIVAESGEGYPSRGPALFRATIQAHGRLLTERPAGHHVETVLLEPAVVVDPAAIDEALRRLGALDEWLAAVAATPLMPPSPKSCHDQRANIADAVEVLERIRAFA